MPQPDPHAASGRHPEPDMRLTIEFDVPESQAHLIDKLVAYAKRIGVTMSARASYDANEPFRRPNNV